MAHLFEPGGQRARTRRNEAERGDAKEKASRRQVDRDYRCLRRQHCRTGDQRGCNTADDCLGARQGATRREFRVARRQTIHRAGEELRRRARGQRRPDRTRRRNPEAISRCRIRRKPRLDRRQFALFRRYVRHAVCRHCKRAAANGSGGDVPGRAGANRLRERQHQLPCALGVDRSPQAGIVHTGAVL